jgi:hypothetical protein
MGVSGAARDTFIHALDDAFHDEPPAPIHSHAASHASRSLFGVFRTGMGEWALTIHSGFTLGQVCHHPAFQP